MQTTGIFVYFDIIPDRIWLKKGVKQKSVVSPEDILYKYEGLDEFDEDDELTLHSETTKNTKDLYEVSDYRELIIPAIHSLLHKYNYNNSYYSLIATGTPLNNFRGLTGKEQNPKSFSAHYANLTRTIKNMIKGPEFASLKLGGHFSYEMYIEFPNSKKALDPNVFKNLDMIAKEAVKWKNAKHAVDNRSTKRAIHGPKQQSPQPKSITFFALGCSINVS